MRLNLAHGLESFRLYRDIRRKGLLLAAIALAMLAYPVLRISQLDPLFLVPLPHTLKPLALYELGYFEQSARSYRAVYRRASKEGAFSDNPLLSAILSEDFGGASAAAVSLLQENPDSLRALNALAETAFRSGELQSAGQRTEQILALKEDDAEALMLAALIAARQQSYESAIRFFELALRTGEAGNILTFLNVLETAGQLRDLNEPPWCLLAHVYRYLRIYDSAKGKWAIRAAEQAIAAGDHRPEAYVTIGIVLEKQGLRQRALESFRKAAQINPSYGMAYRWAAGVYAKSGDRSHEYLMRRAAFEADPSDHLLRDDLYDELRERKAFTQLANSMQRAIDLDPGDLIAHRYIVEAHRQLGHEDQARQYLRKALPLDPHGPQSYEAKAWILQESGRPDEAEPLLLKSQQLDESRPEPYRALARLYQQRGRAEEAFSTYERVVSLRGREEGERVLEFCAWYERRNQSLAKACRDRLFSRQPQPGRGLQ